MATEGDMALALYNQLLADPKTRTDTLKLIKRKFPSASLPELDAAEPVINSVVELRKELAALRGEIADEQTDRKITGKFAKLQADRGLTDEGIQKVQAIMVERNIGDPLAAALVFEHENPTPSVLTPSSYSGLRAFDTKDEDFQSWSKDPDAMLDKTIGIILSEASGRRPN